MQPDFFLLYVRIFLFGVRGVKNFLGFADDVWSSWVEGVWCMWGGGVCEMSVLYNNVSR